MTRGEEFGKKSWADRVEEVRKNKKGKLVNNEYVCLS